MRIENPEIRDKPEMILVNQLRHLKAAK